MEFGKYIHELLLENDTVIIPGFGAFVSTYKPAEISEDSSEMKPPSKEVSFNPQIRNNDGLLVGQIAAGEAISHFDALKLIEKERENIIYRLDKGERVELEETGVLFYDENHEIGFEPFVDENLLLDSFGLETTDMSFDEEEIAEEEPAPPAEEEVPEEPVAVIESGDTAPDPEPEEETPGEPETTEEAHAETEPAEEPVEEEEPVEQEPEPVAVTDPESDEKKKRKGGWWWYLLILVPLVAVSVFLYMKDKQPPEPVIDEPEVTQTMPEQPEALADTLAKDTAGAVETDSVVTEEPVAEMTEQPEATGPKYYLVGGSFKSEENAETFYRELVAKGVEPFHLGKRGNFYIVGIGTYDTEEEASAAKREYLDKHPGSGVWIWKK